MMLDGRSSNPNECDEARPTCDRCRNRGLDCSYQEWTPRNPIHITESESSTCSTETPAGSSGTDSVNADDFVSETDLAHHYISHTCKTLAVASSDEAQTHSWRVVVPALAVASTAVRSGMLSLAACCMYADAPRDAEDDRVALLRIAYSHYHQCLRESQQQLQKLDQAEHVDAVLATTRTLFVIGLALCQIERRLGKSLADPECWAWLPLLRGNAVVMQTVEDSRMSSQATLYSQDMTPEMVPHTTYEGRDSSIDNRLEPPPALNALRQARVSSLFSLRRFLAESRSCLPDERHAQYTAAVDLLDEVMSYTCIFPRIRSFVRVIFIWPTKMPAEFSEALTRGDKFALITYAHWLMLTVLLEDLWIVGDMGRAGIFEIVARSGDWSDEEQKLLLWPRRMLSVNVSSA